MYDIQGSFIYGNFIVNGGISNRYRMLKHFSMLYSTISYKIQNHRIHIGIQ